MARKLRPEEVELWKQVTDRTERLNQGRRPVDFGAMLKMEPQILPMPKRRKLIDTLVKPSGSKVSQKSKSLIRVDRVAPIAEQVRNAKITMDRKAFDQMKRGKLKPEDRLDLHGLTLDRAHSLLTQFILSAYGNGQRLVLIITGKGKSRDDGGPIPVRFGVLRHQVPQWLAMAPLSSAVLQVTQAHNRHGGGGAYYVYLRKPR
jgi:DNA-nicking Smr family endonuclease